MLTGGHIGSNLKSEICHTCVTLIFIGKELFIIENASKTNVQTVQSLSCKDGRGSNDPAGRTQCLAYLTNITSDKVRLDSSFEL